TICGSNTIPTVPILAFAGWRFGLPPLIESTWATVILLFAALPPEPPALPGALLQRMPKGVAPGKGLPLASRPGPEFAQGSFDNSKLPPDCPRYSSRMFGARNAVEYVPRKVTSRTGLQRAPSL